MSQQDIQTKHSWLRHLQAMDQETVTYKPKRKEPSSKCFVFNLCALVILFAVLLAFASVVLRARRPQVQLTSATVSHVSYRTSPSPFFNVTMVAHLSIRNPNYGGFNYENVTVSVLYAGVRVGNREIGGDSVKARETKGMNITVNVSSGKLSVAGNLTGDMNSGMLNLTSYAKFSGTVKLLKIIHKRRGTEMACTVNLNLTSRAIHYIQC